MFICGVFNAWGQSAELSVAWLKVLGILQSSFSILSTEGPNFIRQIFTPRQCVLYNMCWHTPVRTASVFSAVCVDTRQYAPPVCSVQYVLTHASTHRQCVQCSMCWHMPVRTASVFRAICVDTRQYAPPVCPVHYIVVVVVVAAGQTIWPISSN